MTTTQLIRSVATVSVLCTVGHSQITQRMSVDSTGTQAATDSFNASVSGDGRYVAFESTATTLVAADTNAVADVFVRDRLAGQTVRVSVDSNGIEADGKSSTSAMSNDGRCVVFISNATNLILSDNNAVADVFVRDLVSAQTTCASLNSAGAPANNSSLSPSISTDGRYVAFVSTASNLIPGDTNASPDIFVRDRVLGITSCASVTSAGALVQGDCDYTAISADGRYVAFWSTKHQLVPGGTNSADAYVHDNLTGQTMRASVNSAGTPSSCCDSGSSLAISGDGRFVAFVSWATNLVAGDTNNRRDVFVHDMQTSQTTRESVDSLGAQASDESGVPSLSFDGRYLAFQSEASNLVAADTNSAVDIFVRDRQLGKTVRASLDSGGSQSDGYSFAPMISTGGSYVTFSSFATNLVVGDTNGSQDTFIRDFGLMPQVFCTAGTSLHGCVPSIAGTGTPSASSGSGYSISVSNVEGQRAGALFYGVDNSGFTPTPWGPSTSYLCVKPPTQRTGALFSNGTFGACDGLLALDWNAFIATNPAALGNPFSAGQPVIAQGWIRDPGSAKTTMLSNGLVFIVGP